MRLNKTEGRLSRSLVRLRRTEGFVKPELAATLPVNGLTGSVAASSGFDRVRLRQPKSSKSSLGWGN